MWFYSCGECVSLTRYTALRRLWQRLWIVLYLVCRPPHAWCTAHTIYHLYIVLCGKTEKIQYLFATERVQVAGERRRRRRRNIKCTRCTESMVHNGFELKVLWHSTQAEYCVNSILLITKFYCHSKREKTFRYNWRDTNTHTQHTYTRTALSRANKYPFYWIERNVRTWNWNLKVNVIVMRASARAWMRVCVYREAATQSIRRTSRFTFTILIFIS